MKDEAPIALKNQLVLDVMVSSLSIVSIPLIKKRYIWLASMDPWTIMGLI